MNVFWPSGRVMQGAGLLARLQEIAKDFGGHPAVVVDRNLVSNPALASALKAFDPAKIYHYSGAEPQVSGAQAVGEACAGASVIIAIGGGSTIDIAKAAAVLVSGGGPLEQCEGAERVAVEPAPIIAVPSTAGTGSEVTGSSVLETRDGARKMSMRSHKLIPRVAVLDPDLLATTPRSIVAASGIDAFAHATEAFCSTRASAVTDALALGALRLISNNLVAYYRDPSNTAAASAMGWGACMAGMAFNSARVGLAHAIASAIGPQVHLPHGICVAFGLPLAVRLNGPAVGDQRFGLLLEAIGAAGPDSLSPAARAERYVRDLMEQLDLPLSAAAAGRGFEVNGKLLGSILNSGRLETNPAAIDETTLTGLLAEVRG
jgi:alcohol dehydrogenase class IV